LPEGKEVQMESDERGGCSAEKETGKGRCDWRAGLVWVQSACREGFGEKKQAEWGETISNVEFLRQNVFSSFQIGWAALAGGASVRGGYVLILGENWFQFSQIL
jgi:hypothetical protein